MWGFGGKACVLLFYTVRPKKKSRAEGSPGAE
jgi:hypothetical protein